MVPGSDTFQAAKSDANCENHGCRAGGQTNPNHAKTLLGRRGGYRTRDKTSGEQMNRIEIQEYKFASYAEAKAFYKGVLAAKGGAICNEPKQTKDEWVVTLYVPNDNGDY